MGEVYGATDLRTNAPVAVKIVREGARDRVSQQRLHREAVAASKLRSDYVPSVYEVRETEDGDVFLVMERLEGQSLGERLRARGCLSWREMMSIGEDVLRALIDAHTAGVIHRDLKPSNVFLATTGRAHVLDFGVCRFETVDEERLTGTGEAIGTVAYMAPEQIRGASSVDERADLYAFGVLVYESLTGWMPHEGGTQMSILASKLERPAAALVDERGAFPPGLPALVAKLLEREPARRFASAQQVMRAWRDLGDAARPDEARGVRPPMLSGEETSAPLPSAPPPPPPREEGATQTSLTTGLPLRSSGGARVAVAVALVGVVLGIAGIFVVARRAPAAPAAAQLEAPTDTAPPVAPPEATASASAAPAAPQIELPDDPPPVAVATSATPGRPALRPPRKTQPRKAAPAHKPSPHITTEPRY